MKPEIKILNYTQNPLTTIGANASYCYNTKLKDENHARRIAEKVINAGHGRNLEFADLTLHISGVSARMMRELGRHIIGTSYVQASTRYINYNNFEYFTPLNMSVQQYEIYKHTMDVIQENYKKLKDLKTPNDITGYLLPLAMETEVVFKLNARALDHLASMRICTRALAEFRDFMKELKKAIISLQDEEWTWLANNLMKPKCLKQGFCDEEYSCGLIPKKTNATT